MIPVTQKAANTCNYCRMRKQRCDRILPSCSRCAAKLRPCDYTWIKDAPRIIEPGIAQVGPLFVPRGICCSDLSTRGRDELLHAVTACTNRELGSTNKFSELISDMLDLADFQVSGMLEQHATSIHQWCPVIDEELLRKGRKGAYDEHPPDLLPNPLLLLCIFMLTRRTCAHAEHVRTGVLYTTVKQMLAIGQAAGDLSLELFRASMLVSVYECSHGMAKQAFVTLSSCVAMFDLIKSDMRDPDREICNEEVAFSLDATTIMLDRLIALSNISESLQLVCPTKQPLTMYIANRIEPTIPAPSPTPSASSPRKVHIRAVVALESGRVLEYSHSLRSKDDPVEAYDEVDAGVSLVIQKLVDKPQPHTWLHCDAIAMAFCSHLLLQQAQVKQLETQGIAPSHTAMMKALMALHYSRRMAWDMVNVMIRKVEDKDDVPYLPFAGVCCVIRAAIAVLETRMYDSGDMPRHDEIGRLMQIMDWFSKTWSVGVRYLEWARELAMDHVRV